MRLMTCHRRKHRVGTAPAVRRSGSPGDDPRCEYFTMQPTELSGKALPLRLGEAVKRAVRADIKAGIGEGRSGEAGVIQIVDRQRLPIGASLQNSHLAGFADHVYLAVTGYRRRPIAV